MINNKEILMFLKTLHKIGFEVIKSNSGQIAVNNKENTQPLVLLNDINYLTPTPYEYYLIEDEINRIELEEMTPFNYFKDVFFEFDRIFLGREDKDEKK